MAKNILRDNLLEASEFLTKALSEETLFQSFEEAVKTMSSALKGGKKIISCGNGGSMADAMHFAEELSGRFRDERPALAAMAISDPTYLTCAANDYGYDKVFSRFIEAFGQKGDVLLAISTSGNSKNVIAAAERAKIQGMTVVALTGKQGGNLSSFCDIELRAPFSNYADRTQELHIKFIHALIEGIESNL